MFKALSLTFLLLTACASQTADLSSKVDALEAKRSLVLFVADGLRPGSVKAQITPHLFKLKTEGTWFANSHAIFPTTTMTNAAAIATGHFVDDHGVFSDLDSHLRPVVAERTLLSILRKAGFATVAIGKQGPLSLMDEASSFPTATLLIDDSFSKTDFEKLPIDIQEEFKLHKISLTPPSRGANSNPGTAKTPGTRQANVNQQKYFMDVLTKVLLPVYKKRNQPFAIVFWSRDPDGTQHFNGDSLQKPVPGINGATSTTALKNVDNNFGDLRAALKRLDLENSTDVFVTSDHGFSTISKQSKTSRAATYAYAHTPIRTLPSGFLAIDLAHALSLKVYDQTTNKPVDPVKGESPTHAVLGRKVDAPEIMIVQNGGADLIYLSEKFSSQKRIGDIMKALVKQDYVSGIFVHDKFGEWPASLPLSKLQMLGKTKLPEPSLLVGFKSFGTGCAVAIECTALVSDTPLQQGQGMHGSLGRADTFNFMAAIGPSFKSHTIIKTPAATTDILPTVLFSRQLSTKNHGGAKGRVLYESLRGFENKNKLAQQIEFISPQTLDGFKTILKVQIIDGTTYFDAAGFLGRTVGLE